MDKIVILGFKFFFEKSNIIKKKNIGENTKNNFIEDHIFPLNINIKKNIIKYIKKHLINTLKSFLFENSFNEYNQESFRIYFELKGLGSLGRKINQYTEKNSIQ